MFLSVQCAPAQQTITYTNDENNSGGISINFGNTLETLTIASGSALQSGIISDFSPSWIGNVGKSGAGTLILTGADTYHGTTTISAGTLAIGSGGSIADSSGLDLTSSGTTFDISAGGNQTIMGLSGVSGSTVNLGANSLAVTPNGGNFAGSIQGTGGIISGSPSNTNTAPLVLSGTNTYTGGTSVLGGILQFGQESSLYNGQAASWTAANIGVSSGATLALNVGGFGEFTSNDVATVLQNLGNRTGGFASGSAIGFDTDNASGGIFTYSGNISDANSGINVLGLVKLGSGTLSLTGTNTYSGPTTIKAGTLQVIGSLGAASTVNVGSAGTLSGSGTVNGNVTVTGGGVINFTNTGSIGGTLGVSGGNWNGAGTVDGPVTVSSGIFTLGTGASLSALGGLNVTGTGSLSGFGGTINSSVDYTSSGSSSAVSPIVGAGNTVTMNNSQGRLDLTGADTYTGPTIVMAGILIVDGSTSLASNVTIGPGGNFNPNGGYPGNGVVGGNVALNSGGKLTFSNWSIIEGSLDISGGTLAGNGTVNGPITISSGQVTLTNASINAPSGVFVTGGSINDAGDSGFSGSLTYTSPLASTIGAVGTDSAGSFVIVDNPSANLTLSSVGVSPTTVMAGTLTTLGELWNVELDSGSTLVISATGSVHGNANLLGATVNGNGWIYGTVAASGNNVFEGSLSADSPITSTSGSITIASGADLWVYGGLNITGGTLAAGSSTSTIIGDVVYSSSSISNFGGVIAGSGFDKVSTDSGGSVTVNNTSGTLILSGANIYTGGTTVTAGTLLANGSNSTGSGAVSIASGGALGGSGTIKTSGVTSGAAITFAAGASLNQSVVSGGLGTSTLTLNLQSTGATTTVDLLQGSKFAFDLGGSGVNDQLTVTHGTLTLAGQNFSDFTFTTLSGFNGAGTYDLFVTDTVGDLLGSLGEASGTIDGYNATLSVFNSQDLVLKVNAAPEPAAWGLGLVCLGMFALLRWSTATRKTTRFEN